MDRIYKMSVLAALAAASFAHAQTATVVQPGSQYFTNWAFTEFLSIPPAEIPVPAQTDDSSISLAGRALTIRVQAKGTGDTFGVWPSNYAGWGGGSTFPTNIGRPRAPAQVFMNRGTASFMFDQPLPRGSGFFFSDFDGNEVFEYRFVDCAGNIVDAGDFSFLQVSRTSATNPPAYSIEGAAPNRYWRVAALTAVNDPNSTNGIVIESDAVCGVQLFGTRPRGNGSVNYSFGVPKVALLSAVKSLVSVNDAPADGPVRPRDTLEYAIALTNPSSVEVTVPAGDIQETLPANTALADGLDFHCAGTACTNTNPVVVAAGASAVLRLAVQVDAGVDPATVPGIVNAIAINGLDCAASGNQCSVNTQLVAQTPAVQTTAIPVNKPWALLLMGLALVGFAARVTKRLRL